VVWPSAKGKVVGAAIAPLAPSVPDAALASPPLYELLALVDALRIGAARDREAAGPRLAHRLAGVEAVDASTEHLPQQQLLP
jgi:hypothetical protein